MVVLVLFYVEFRSKYFLMVSRSDLFVFGYPSVFMTITTREYVRIDLYGCFDRR